MNIKIGVSNRHVHLCEEDFRILFGDIELEVERMLVQPYQYASPLKVTLTTEKSKIDNVRVLGPLRNYTQVEISKTDSFTLGLKPPIRNSGDLDSAEVVTIVGPNGSVTKPCCIIATRHLHINHEDRTNLGLLNQEYISVRINGEKPTILENVYLKEEANAVLEFHIDTDDANACFAKTGQEAEIIN